MKIETKFDIGQDVYTIRHNNSIYHTKIDIISLIEINGEVCVFYYYDQPGSYAHCEEIEKNLFATREEAEAKLKELKGEGK